MTSFVADLHAIRDRYKSGHLTHDTAETAVKAAFTAHGMAAVPGDIRRVLDSDSDLETAYRGCI